MFLFTYLFILDNAPGDFWPAMQASLDW